MMPWRSRPSNGDPRLGWTRRVALALSVCLTFVALTGTTLVLYSRTHDHPTLNPENILTGRSQAPNQYRILVPLLYGALRNSLDLEPASADFVVLAGSILFCFAATGALFVRTGGSPALAAVGQVAVIGACTLGMFWKARQEFFEMGVVSLTLLVLLRSASTRATYAWLCLLTLLGSLNRETHIFCLIAVSTHIVLEHHADRRLDRLRWHAGPQTLLYAIYAATFVGVRWRFGLSPYDSELWTWRRNLENLTSIAHPNHVLYLGSGVLVAWLASWIRGNRALAPFIIGYSAPLFAVGFFITNFYEHRVFYPLMPLLIASLLSPSRPSMRLVPPSEGDGRGVAGERGV